MALCLQAIAADAETQQDVQLWSELGVRYEPARRWRLSFDQHLRIDQDVSRVRAHMSELALRFSPRPFVRFAGGYRFSTELDNDGLHQRRHRLHLDVSLRHRWRPVMIGFRLRFQEEARADDDDGEPWRHTFRFRLEGVFRRVPVVDPFLHFELFLRVASPDGAAIVRKLRGTVGIEFETSVGGLNIGYRIDGNLVDQLATHIVLLGWMFDILSDRRR